MSDATQNYTSRLLPVVDDPDTGGFFRAAGEGKLAILHCRRCGSALHMPVGYCRFCSSWETRWESVRGTGTVYSWTVVEHQVHPAFPVPYTVILVELDDLPGIRLVGRLDGSPVLGAGTAVRVRMHQLSDDTTLPQWELVERASH